MSHYLKLLLQLFLAPQSGWEDVSAEPQTPDKLVKHGLLPLAGISALTSFLSLAYHPGQEVTSLLVKALIEFAAYVIGYYIAILALTAYMPKVKKPGHWAEEREIRLFALCLSGLMALVGLVRNCLPSDFAIVYFLYVYLAIVAWRGKDMLGVSDDKTVTFVILAIVATIIPPLLIMML